MRFLGARWSEEMDSCLAKMSDRIQTFFFFLNFGEHGSGGFSGVTFAAREKKKEKEQTWKPGGGQKKKLKCVPM